MNVKKQRDAYRTSKHGSCLSFHVWIPRLFSGWYEGERLRDGERGWFAASCAEQITCQATIERNMQRMNRLQGLETNVWGRGAGCLKPQRAFLSCYWSIDTAVTCLFFFYPWTETNEFSNSISDLPSGNKWIRIEAAWLLNPLQV